MINLSEPVLVTLIMSAFGLINAFSLLLITYFIRRLEKNTNSIKDELVAVTRSDAFQRGEAHGKSNATTTENK